MIRTTAERFATAHLWRRAASRAHAGLGDAPGEPGVSLGRRGPGEPRQGAMEGRDAAPRRTGDDVPAPGALGESRRSAFWRPAVPSCRGIPNAAISPQRRAFAATRVCRRGSFRWQLSGRRTGVARSATENTSTATESCPASFPCRCRAHQGENQPCSAGPRASASSASAPGIPDREADASSRTLSASITKSSITASITCRPVIDGHGLPRISSVHRRTSPQTRSSLQGAPEQFFLHCRLRRHRRDQPGASLPWLPPRFPSACNPWSVRSGTRPSSRYATPP